MTLLQKCGVASGVMVVLLGVCLLAGGMPFQTIQREAAAIKGNCELIQLRRVEMWDGVLPKFSGGGVVPFLEVNQVTD